jgi:hypothetical protein
MSLIQIVVALLLAFIGMVILAPISGTDRASRWKCRCR